MKDLTPYLSRKYFTAAKYGVLNPKVLSFSGGIGSLKTVSQATWIGVRDTAKKVPKGSAFAIFFTISIDISEWIDGYLEIDPKTGKSKKDVLELMVKIGMDVVKLFVGVALGVIAAALLAAFISFAFGVVVTGSVLVIGGLVCAAVIGYFLEYQDAKHGVTKSVNEIAHDIYQKFSDRLHATYDYLEQKMPKDYESYPEAMKLIFSSK
jgi:hypothetical protein